MIDCSQGSQLVLHRPSLVAFIRPASWCVSTPSSFIISLLHKPAKQKTGLFKKFVEIGRVARINYGPDAGKLCTIIDVVDHNRVWWGSVLSNPATGTR